MPWNQREASWNSSENSVHEQTYIDIQYCRFFCWICLVVFWCWSIWFLIGIGLLFLGHGIVWLRRQWRMKMKVEWRGALGKTHSSMLAVLAQLENQYFHSDNGNNTCYPWCWCNGTSNMCYHTERLIGLSCLTGMKLLQVSTSITSLLGNLMICALTRAKTFVCNR